MKLLVTGGAGFIGSNFILYYLNNHSSDHIVNLDKLTYAGNLENLKSVENNPSYQFIKGDICDVDLVDGIMKDIDIIVHFAAETHVDRSITNASDFIQTNVAGTQILLSSAKKYNVKRFHHISTDEVFGSLKLGDGQKFNENTSYDPRNPYSASKAGADHLVRAYYNTYNLPVTISNCSNNYGPYQYPEKLISLAITNLLEGKKVPVYGDGKYVRDWLYVTDHVKAINLILQKGKIGETYFIGGLTDEISNLEIIGKILKIMEKNDDFIEYVADRPGHDRKYMIDWTKINRELGWRPEVSIDQGLKLTVDWYTQNQMWWEKLKLVENGWK